MIQITLAHTLLAQAVAAALIFARFLEARDASVAGVTLTVPAHSGCRALAVAGAYLAIMLGACGDAAGWA